MPKKSNKNNETFLKTMYKEAGINYRYFLSWRHKLMVRFFIFVAAVFVVFQWIYEDKISMEAAWLIPFLSLFIILAFWSLDHRSKTLFRACQKSGGELEKEMIEKKNIGPYNKINLTTSSNIIIASKVMGFVYALTAFCFLLSALYLIAAY